MKPMNNDKKTRTTILVFLALFFFFSPRTEALSTDFYDNWDADNWGSTLDGISWINTGCPLTTFTTTQSMFTGVKDNNYPVYAYCTNNARDSDSSYDICFVKNSTYQDEADLVSLSFPVTPWILSETITDWAYADNLAGYEDLFFDSCDSFGETNPIISSVKRVKRAQTQYYGINPFAIKDTYSSNLDTSSGTDIRGTNRWYYQNFTTSNNILRFIEIYVYSYQGIPHDLRVSIKDSANNVLLTKTIAYTDLPLGYNNITFQYGYYLNTSTKYKVVFDCPTCTNSDGYYLSMSTDTSEGVGQFSGDSGSTWSNYVNGKSIYLNVYTDDGLRSLGSTSVDDSQNYFFVDKMLLTCQSDGSDFLNLDGQFATDTYISVSTAVSCYNLEGNTNGYICDAQHDETTSTNKDVLPTSPCRLDTGESCTLASECWHNAECSGARTDYDGLCHNTNVTIETIPYTDSCGGAGNVGTITDDGAGSTCQSQGFPLGYVCDNAYENVVRSTTNQVYNDMCKASLGVSCASDSDCKTGLTCQAGFCGYFSYSVFTTNITGNSIMKDSYITFDPTLSIGNNIQYACWNYNGVNDKCYGNSGNCSTSCNGANYSGSNWETTYSKKFSINGSINVLLTTGETSLYQSNYSESFCVSGGNTYCFSCTDNMQNDDETSADWGGRCGTPYFYKCNNLQLDNQTGETSIDYGGYCGNCLNNSDVNDDLDWSFLKEADLIILPFNQSQCPQSQELQGGFVSFVLIITGLLFLPLIILAIILISFIIYYVFIIGIFVYRAYKTYKEVEKRLK